MKGLKDEFSGTGYNQEEFYFHRLNQELIERMKEKGFQVIQGGGAGSQAPQGKITEVTANTKAKGSGQQRKKAA